MGYSEGIFQNRISLKLDHFQCGIFLRHLITFSRKNVIIINFVTIQIHSKTNKDIYYLYNGDRKKIEYLYTYKSVCERHAYEIRHLASHF